MLSYRVNQKDISANGTSLVGYLKITYEELVKFFGEPKGGSADGKTTCEWIIEFEDGCIGNIYDWKTNNTPKDLYKWNIGSYTPKVLEHLEKVTNFKTIAF